MHQDPVPLGDVGDLSDGLDRTDLIVGVHDGDEDGRRRKSLFNVGGVHEAGFIYRHDGKAESLGFEIPADFDHGRMLDSGRDDVVASVAQSFSDAADGKVVRLGAAAGEDDLIGACPTSPRPAAAQDSTAFLVRAP